METISQAALFYGGEIYTVPRPGRHCDVIKMMCNDYGLRNMSRPENQGFVTSTGRFVNREEGLKIAQEANQIIKKHPRASELYSEDMW